MENQTNDLTVIEEFSEHLRQLQSPDFSQVALEIVERLTKTENPWIAAHDMIRVSGQILGSIHIEGPAGLREQLRRLVNDLVMNHKSQSIAFNKCVSSIAISGAKSPAFYINLSRKNWKEEPPTTPSTVIYDLFKAIEEGDTEHALSLLDNEIKDVNVRSIGGSAPLHAATQKKNIDLIKALLDRKANPNIQNSFGNTPLHIAVSTHSFRSPLTIIELLLEAGADPNIENINGLSPLMLNKTHPVKVTLFRRAIEKVKHPQSEVEETHTNPPSEPDESGSTHLLDAANAAKRLHDAIGRDDTKKAISILDNEIKDPDIADTFGRTPMHNAAYRRNTALIQALIDRGANIDAQNSSGNTPLGIAIFGYREGQTTDHIELLLAAGANPNVENTKGCTPLKSCSRKRPLLTLINQYCRTPQPSLPHGEAALLRSNDAQPQKQQETAPKIGVLLTAPNTTSSLGAETISEWFARKGVTIETQNDPSGEALFTEVAELIGSNYEATWAMFKAIKVCYLTKSVVANINIKKLEEEQVNAVRYVCSVLRNKGFIQWFRLEENLTIGLHTNSEEISSFLTGKWLEWYVYSIVKQLSTRDVQHSIVLTSNAGKNEVDVAVLRDNGELWLIECKNGFNNDLVKINQMRSLLRDRNLKFINVVSNIKNCDLEGMRRLHSKEDLVITNFAELLETLHTHIGGEPASQ